MSMLNQYELAGYASFLITRSSIQRRSFTTCYLLYSCLVITHTDAYEEYTQKT